MCCVSAGPVAVKPPQVSLALSDSEVEIVGVQENPRFVLRMFYNTIFNVNRFLKKYCFSIYTYFVSV